MPAFLRIENGAVVGYASGARLTEKDGLVPATRELLVELRALEAQLSQSGRSALTARVQYADGVLSLPPDTRPYLRITSDKAEIEADGVDTATITFEVLRQSGSVNTGFSATHTFTMYGRILRLRFTAGVATKPFRTTQSGVYSLNSTDDYRLESPFSLLAYE